MSTLISVLIPFLNEEETIDAMFNRFTEINSRYPNYEFEYILVDDGSTDDSVKKIRSYKDDLLNIKLISFSRNFGSHAAISSGLEECQGDCAIVLGADLQEPPELIDSFLAEFEQGNEVVWGIRNVRSAKGLGGLFSKAFSKLFHRFSEIKTYPEEGPSGVLIARNVIDVVTKMSERNRNILGLIAWSGFHQSRVEYIQDPRLAGVSKWTKKRLLKLAVDSFVQFSSAPIRGMSYVGAITAFLGFFYAFIIIIQHLLLSNGPSGWATVSVLILVIGGIQLIMLGVLGEYIWRGTEETRSRPLFIVRSREEFGNVDQRQKIEH